jgi:hypothetical protein
MVDVVAASSLEDYVAAAASGATEMLALMRRAYVERRAEGAFDKLGYEDR